MSRPSEDEIANALMCLGSLVDQYGDNFDVQMLKVLHRASVKPELWGAGQVAGFLGIAPHNVKRAMEAAGIEPEYIRDQRQGGRLYDAEQVRNPPGREPRSHCSNGHEMTAGNTSAQGRCKRCEAERVAKYKAGQAAQPDDKGTGR